MALYKIFKANLRFCVQGRNQQNNNKRFISASFKNKQTEESATRIKPIQGLIVDSVALRTLHHAAKT